MLIALAIVSALSLVALFDLVTAPVCDWADEDTGKFKRLEAEAETWTEQKSQTKQLSTSVSKRHYPN
jgi:hypothetical protein